ncbi:MAG: UvrD-helicase domain-containing protein [Myxococcales bacterium]|nr:UvrD-helicase domain-containing protein [Myxococcales bacterium]
MSKRQITIKPTCMHELQAFPADRTAVLWEKINFLVTDPVPDGKVKKRLVGSDGICRLRVGDHRVFYQFGDTWVSLLAIRRRNEGTYHDIPGEERPDLPPDAEADFDALPEDKVAPQFTFTSAPQTQPLPFAITRAWLKGLGVPTSAHATLIRCRSEDDLLEASVPAGVLARVVEAIFPPSLRVVVAQPDLLVPSPDHLVRYKEGDLLGFLLNLDADQRKLTSWALSGPTMVTGGAGTGKSTVALYRVKEVLERAGSTGKERLLFTTYTQALLTVTRQLLEQLLTPDQLKRVEVSTADQVAYEIVRSRRKIAPVESSTEALRRLKALRKGFQVGGASAFEGRLQARALARLSDTYLVEEFDWIITGRGLTSLEQYLEAPRPGRGVAFPARLRAAVWELYAAFCAQRKGESFPGLRNEALEVVRAGSWRGHWDHVFVDEAQDLSPVALSLLAESCRTAEGLFFAADGKQSLYSRNYTWTSANPRLQFRGRTATLKRNYRSTAQIDRAAFSLLRPEESEPLESSTSIHEGPLPVLVRGLAAEREPEWISRFVRQVSKHLHLKQSAAAVLVPTAEIGEGIAAALADQGLPAKYFKGRELDLRQDVVKVMSLHSAKGLEFPVVVAAGFHPGTYSVPEDFDEADLFAERMRNERRLLYVACTRAMRGLMVMVPAGCRHEALLQLDSSQWHVEEPAV